MMILNMCIEGIGGAEVPWMTRKTVITFYHIH